MLCTRNHNDKREITIEDPDSEEFAKFTVLLGGPNPGHAEPSYLALPAHSSTASAQIWPKTSSLRHGTSCRGQKNAGKNMIGRTAGI